MFVARLFAITVTAAAVSPAATVVALYEFNNTLNPTSGIGSGSAGALVEVDPGGVSGFAADTVNGVNRTVFRFNGSASPATAQGGLQFVNANLMNPNGYTIELYFSFDAVSSWRRILDTQDRSSDQGFYVLNGGLQLYPSNVGLGAFNADTYYHVLLTFDGTTAVAYLNGSAESTEATNYYSLPASNLISLFLDNTAGPAQTEYSPGRIAWARFWDGALTAQEADAAYRGAIVFDPGPTGDIPEPSTLLLSAAGLAAIAAFRKR
jgi:hypothetical protein